MSNAVKVYSFPLSGHSHRIELFASLAGINHEIIKVDLAVGEHKQQPFLKLNPLGKVPVIEDGDVVLSDSNAILVYLARKYASNWLPTDPVEEAEVQRILSLAANEIANGPAAARLANVFGADVDTDRAKGIAAVVFEYFETHLNDREWLVGSKPTIADIAVYTYTAHAPEGDISLKDYPKIQALLARIEALPGFVPMPKTPVGLAA
ncbi:glutathione S-transferase family protein [Labrenzia sp. PHM005]|uniref:glutathione S-transferase family protein n=1 Tax=Labrenzia sp. PHM005 TaxID=2590016 RepID=UPI00114006D4|nr:glutathione S-transferase [Labrenzia sp. PHM005]QDG75817.1 glutathione S-transferase [Labrenzia sp. PHM005]